MLEVKASRFLLNKKHYNKNHFRNNTDLTGDNSYTKLYYNVSTTNLDKFTKPNSSRSRDDSINKSRDRSQ